MAKFTLEGIINSPQFDIRNSNIRPGDLSSAAATLAYRQRLEEIKRVAGDKSKYKAIVVGYKGGVNPNAPYLYAAMGNTSYAETLFERQARHSPAPPDWLTNTMQMMAGYGSEPDYTDPELIEYSIVTDPDAIGFGTVLAPEESIIDGEPGMSAVDLGMSTTPPPLTGENQDGNKVASIDEGPNGEEIKQNSKGQFYYHPGGDTTQAIVVKAKVNSQRKAIIIDKNPKPDEGLVLITDLFSYNAAGDFMTNVSEEPTTSVSTEVEEQRADRTNIESALTNPIEMIY